MIHIQNRSKGTQQTFISVLPKYFIVCVKRFFWEGNGTKRGKISSKISYPETGLDLGRYMLNNKEPVLYNLVSVAVSSGIVL